VAGRFQIDESQRPDAITGVELTPQQQLPGEHLRRIHDMYRAELAHLVGVTGQVERGVAQVADVRQALHELSLRRELAQYGSICGRFCQVVTVHHTIEDQQMFPRVRAGGEAYAHVVDQLEHEHGLIHQLLLAIDAALVAVFDGTGPLGDVIDRIGDLESLLLSHFDYEEQQLSEPLGLLGVDV
jgi:iron-sulfur cluster repair protein YtfE (RIC family)